MRHVVVTAQRIVDERTREYEQLRLYTALVCNLYEILDSSMSWKFGDTLPRNLPTSEVKPRCFSSKALVSLIAVTSVQSDAASPDSAEVS